MGERVGMVGALSVEAAAKYLNAHDIDGIVVGDGFSPRMVEAFLTMLAQDTRFRDIPVAVIGRRTVPAADFYDSLPNIDHVDGDPARLVARMVPLVRMHAFEARLKRMLKSLDADGMFDPQTGLLTREAFAQDLASAVAEASDRSQPLSLARIAFDGAPDERASLDGARMVTRLTRAIDFACRDDDGAILVAFTQTDLASAHVVARRIAGVLKNIVMAQRGVSAHRQCDAGDAEGRRYARQPDAAGHGPRAGCRRVDRRLRFAPKGASHVQPTTRPHRRRLRRGLPVVLHRQAPAGKGARAQAGHSGRGALAPLFPQ